MKNRYYFIDILKGIGICQFILWHIFVNFYQYPKFDSPVFRLNFSVTGLFVFLSGFIIGFHYFLKLKDLDQFLFVFKRLLLRSLKLLAMVFFVGFVMRFPNPDNFFLTSIDVLLDIFSLFYKDRWDISLQVLVAIAVTLNIGYLVLFFWNSKKFHVFMVALFLSIIFFEHIFDYQSPYLWRYSIIGVLGIYIGVLYKRIFLRDPNLKSDGFKLLSLCCFVVFFLFEFGVFFSKSFYLTCLFKISLQSLAVVSFFSGCSFFLYRLFDKEGISLSKYRPQSYLVLLGKHSLFVYILQIVLINMVDILVSPSFTKQIECFYFFVLILACCVIACWLIELFLRSVLSASVRDFNT